MGMRTEDNLYEVTVVATDSKANTATRDVTVKVTNVEEERDCNPVVAPAADWSSDNCHADRS